VAEQRQQLDELSRELGREKDQLERLASQLEVRSAVEGSGQVVCMVQLPVALYIERQQSRQGAFFLKTWKQSLCIASGVVFFNCCHRTSE